MVPRWLAGALCLFAFVSTAAAEVLVEGSAPVVDNDIGRARELATRRALARAAESHAATVSAQSSARPNVTQELVQVAASACTRNVHPVSETVRDGELTVVLRVTVLDQGDCRSSCQRSTINRVVVTRFALEFPEQMLPAEKISVSTVSAVETAKMIGKVGRLLADYDDVLIPYRSPARAPESYSGPTDKETPFAKLAKDRRGQYVLAGVYRDFGVRKKSSLFWSSNCRRMEIEAFLHDGINGAALARRTFVREVCGDVGFDNKYPVGSAAFYANDPGRTWGLLLVDVARWASDEAACLPFVTRVLKTDGALIYVDAGAESRLSAGDTLSVQTWREPPVRAITGAPLGQEKYPRATAVIKSVYPAFAIAELIETPKGGVLLKPGDLLYAQ
ncbi:MAG: flagellar assembly protein T N-terminal domain-containing protein [Sulfurisoma sp.]|nr:flagellar assembly protein T N-terminal domain-containing protein [Sulfurisoma sp.]